MQHHTDDPQRVEHTAMQTMAGLLDAANACADSLERELGTGGAAILWILRPGHAGAPRKMGPYVEMLAQTFTVVPLALEQLHDRGWTVRGDYVPSGPDRRERGIWRIEATATPDDLDEDADR